MVLYFLILVLSVNRKFGLGLVICSLGLGLDLGLANLILFTAVSGVQHSAAYRSRFLFNLG